MVVVFMPFDDCKLLVNDFLYLVSVPRIKEVLLGILAHVFPHVLFDSVPCAVMVDRLGTFVDGAQHVSIKLGVKHIFATATVFPEHAAAIPSMRKGVRAKRCVLLCCTSSFVLSGKGLM